MKGLKRLKQHAVLGAILTGAFSLVLTNSAFNVLLPYFVEYYEISTTTGGWIIALYMLAMTLTMPTAALIVDRLGRKRTYMLGIALYGLFSIAGALFHAHVAVLLLVRFMHGVAAGLIVPLSLVLLFDYYGTEVRGRVTGAWGMLLMLAPAIGPTLGGIIIQFGRLEYLFWLNVPFALFSLVWCGSHIQAYLPARRKRLHASNLARLIAGIAALSLGVQLYSGSTVPRAVPWMMLAAGIGLLVRFAQQEHRCDEPMIRYPLLRRNRVFALTVLISTIQDSAMFGAVFALPLLFQEVFGLSPSLSGMMFLPAAVCTSLFMWIGGNLMDKGNSLRFIVWGTLLVILSLLAFALLPQGTAVAVMLLLMACRGTGIGLSGMSVTAIGLQALSEEDRHEGSALSTTIERLASSFALMIITLYYDNRWQGMAEAGQTVEAAKWHTLREVYIALGIALMLTLPMILSITRKKVGIIGDHKRNTV